jgi:peptide/nickel transport system permease protein
MQQYVIRRVLLGIPTILLTIILIFFMLRILPGDVAETMLMGGESGHAGEVIPEETRLALLKELGLDKPLHIQLLDMVWKMTRLDLGNSLYSGRSFWTEMAQRAPVTIQISLMAKVLAIALGVPLGILSAIKQDSMPDYISRFFAIMFLAVPNFWLGLLVLLVGASVFNWMPPAGTNHLWETPMENLKQTIWPIIILASSSMAVIARMTRSTMLEVLRDDYIRTARSKGLTERTVLVRHALRNALIPVVTIIGLSFAHLLAGSVVMERVFSIPGVGLFFITSITRQDYPMIQGVVFVIAVSFVFVNLLVDLLYGLMDPRISYSNG